MKVRLSSPAEGFFYLRLLRSAASVILRLALQNFIAVLFPGLHKLVYSLEFISNREFPNRDTLSHTNTAALNEHEQHMKRTLWIE